MLIHEILNTTETHPLIKKVLCEKGDCLVHTISLIIICLLLLVVISTSCYCYHTKHQIKNQIKHQIKWMI